jgi:hypothetical protein
MAALYFGFRVEKGKGIASPFFARHGGGTPPPRKKTGDFSPVFSKYDVRRN